MEITQIEETMEMEKVEMVMVETGEEILDRVLMGIKVTDPLQASNNESGGNRYRTNSSDNSNLN